MKKVFIIILTVLAAASCRTGDLFERNAYSLETSTRMAGEIVAGAPGYFGHIKSDKVTNVGQGVSLLDLNCLNMNGYSVRMLLYKVSLGSATLDVALPSGENKSGLTSVLAGGLDAESTLT